MKHVLFMLAGAYVDLATMISLNPVIEWATAPSGGTAGVVKDWVPLAYATAGVAIGTALLAFGTIKLVRKPIHGLVDRLAGKIRESHRKGT